MKSKSRLKFLKVFLLVAIGGMAAMVFFYLCRNQPTDSGKPEESQPFSRSPSSDRSLIRGVRYSAIIGGEATLSIEADQFRIGKKKIGFLSVSLLDEVEIRNARIRIMKKPAQALPEGSGASKETFSQSSSEQMPLSSMEKDQTKEQSALLMDSARAVLSEIERSKAFPGVSSARVVFVKIAPIEFQVHEGNASLLTISAGEAGFDLKNRRIVFSEGVHASAGMESWTGDELSLDPSSGTVTGKRKGGAKAREKKEDLSRIFHGFKKVEAVKGKGE